MLYTNKTMMCTHNIKDIIFGNSHCSSRSNSISSSESIWGKHIESLNDEKLVSDLVLDKLRSDSLETISLYSEDDKKELELVFDDEQFNLILSNNFNTFEPQPFETDDEWYIIQQENAKEEEIRINDMKEDELNHNENEDERHDSDYEK